MGDPVVRTVVRRVPVAAGLRNSKVYTQNPSRTYP
jgi:hypothetical protein